MPRTAVTTQTPKGPHPGTVTANLLDITFSAVDAANGNYFTFSGKHLLLVRNTHATNAITMTLTSVADSKGRLGTITTYSLEAGEQLAFLVTDKEGWRQTDDGFYMDWAGTGTGGVAVLNLP